MSGRKDYSFILDAMRAAAQNAAILARQAERVQQTHARLERAKADAQRFVAELGQRQRESNHQRMQAASESTRLAIEAQAEQATRIRTMEAESQRESASAKKAEQELKRKAEQERQIEIAAVASKELQAEIEKQMQTVLQWQQSFSENENVKNFAADQFASWVQGVEKTIEEIKVAEPSPDLLTRLQEATISAEQLESKSGEVSDQFYSRNLVMKDIVDALKEIGFFVQDPEFADPRYPEGAVIIRANRGNENLTTSVSLDQQVESDWQGIHGEYCTGGFFEYVKAMDNRGVKITPTDPHLAPLLLQKGAKDLPSGNETSAGGSR